MDELAGQVQMLESARLRLEMAMEQMRKENKKELAQRDEEMEDTRCSAQKKVKGTLLPPPGLVNHQGINKLCHHLQSFPSFYTFKCVIKPQNGTQPP